MLNVLLFSIFAFILHIIIVIVSSMRMFVIYLFENLFICVFDMSKEYNFVSLFTFMFFNSNILAVVVAI